MKKSLIFLIFVSQSLEITASNASPAKKSALDMLAEICATQTTVKPLDVFGPSAAVASLGACPVSTSVHLPLGPKQVSEPSLSEDEDLTKVQLPEPIQPGEYPKNKHYAHYAKVSGEKIYCSCGHFNCLKKSLDTRFKEHRNNFKNREARVFPCVRCGQIITKQGNMERHLKSCTGVASAAAIAAAQAAKQYSPEWQFPCPHPDCLSVFSTKDGLKYHLEKEHSKNLPPKPF